MVVSYCMPGSPHCQVASAILFIMSRARYSLTGVRASTVRVEKVGVGLDGLHELVGDADGVVGVLEEDGAVGLGVRAGGRRSLRPDEREALASSFWLALDEVDDVGMVDVEDDHLGGAAGLAAAT